MIKLMKIAFRVDSSSKISAGHLMRCINLASVLKEKVESILFISREHKGNSNKLVTEKGFDLAVLNASENDMEKGLKNQTDNYKDWLGVSQIKDANETKDILKEYKPDWMIVDHYSLDETWEKIISEYVKKMMVIDDLANRKHYCDFLLDHNWFEKIDNRYRNLIPENCSKFLGPEFALLKSDFSLQKKNFNYIHEEIKTIFIFFGSTDPYNLTSMAIISLSESRLKHLYLKVVIGDTNIHMEEIRQLIKLRGNAELHIQVENIEQIMANSQIAIASGGVNTWERICIGLPTLFIDYADNHSIFIDDLSKNHYLKYLGNYKKINSKNLTSSIIDFISDKYFLDTQNKVCISLFDGNGCQKISKWLLGDIIKRDWKVKKAELSDSELYWFWVNDPQVRINSNYKSYISWSNHLKWFSGKIKNDKSFLYLISIDKNFIGQVRFDEEKQYAKIDYSIAKQFRGFKLGLKMLSMAIEKYQRKSEFIIFGEVYKNNIASVKIFESLNFDVKIKKNKKIFTLNRKLFNYV